MPKYYKYNRNGCKITFECGDANITNEVDRFIQRIIDAENYRTLHYEQGQLPDNGEVFGYDGLIQAYRVGKRKHEMYSHEYGTAKHDDDKCMKLLIEIIKAVMSYE